LHPAFENLDDDHAAATAWAWRSRIFWCGGSNCPRRWLWSNPEQFARTCDICLATAAGEQAVVTDTVEALWQDMEEKAPDELADGERHDALPVGSVATIIFIAEGHACFVQGDQPTVRDGHAMGVARQVGKYRLRASEWRLGVGNPILLSERRDVAEERTPLAQTDMVAEELDPAGDVKLDQPSQE